MVETSFSNKNTRKREKKKRKPSDQQHGRVTLRVIKQEGIYVYNMYDYKYRFKTV